MSSLVIKYIPEVRDGSCAWCAKPTGEMNEGLALCPEGSAAPVCRDCGRAEAPCLQALLDLARAARRAGTVSRAAPWLPLEVLLGLSVAAEKFVQAAEQPGAPG